MTKDLTHFKRILTYYLITEHNAAGIFDIFAFEQYLKKHQHGKYVTTWEKLFKQLPIVKGKQIPNAMQQINHADYQIVQQQLATYGSNICYNPVAIGHRIINPLTNLGVYLMVKQQLKQLNLNDLNINDK